MVLAALLIVAAAGSTFSLYRQIQNGVESAGWPQVKGVIVSSDIRTRLSNTTRGSTQVDHYYPDVRFAYSVDGRSYQGRLVSFFSEETAAEADAAAIVARYPLKTEVQVFYKPNRPDLAVLEPGAPARPVLLTILFVFLFCGPLMAGAAFFIYWYNRLKNARCQDGIYFLQ